VQVQAGLAGPDRLGGQLQAVQHQVRRDLQQDLVLAAGGLALGSVGRGYVHFQFHDYARLTVIGVIVAYAAWPVVTRISAVPQWLFFRLAILVTLVLWLPDVYIMYRGQPADAVAILVLMHLAIALVTYNLLVRLAPSGPVPRHASGAPKVLFDADAR